MHTGSLRKVGGSVMLTVPSALLDALDMRPGTKIAIQVENGRLIVDRQKKPRSRLRYTLAELLAQCKPRDRRTRSDRIWTTGGHAGSELI
jgi:antitoxin ChpS